MTSLKSSAALCSTLVLCAACTSGNARIEPPYQSVNPLVNKLEFAVGTANYQVVDTSSTATPPPVLTLTGLNTVATFRKPNGDSGTLVNSPNILGPSGFLVPAGSTEAGIDAGTSSITSTPQSDQPGASTTPETTFGQAGGVFSYGIQPFDADNNAEAGDVVFTPYTQPFYTDASSAMHEDVGVVYLGGPPAYTNVRTGTYPGAFLGFTEGFDSFATQVAAGTYTLHVTVPTSTSTSGTLTSTSTLSTTATLPTYAAPATDTEDGTGGATIPITVPAGVTETLLNVVDTGTDPASMDTSCHTGYSAPFYYTVVDHTAGPAVVTVTLPDNDGPISATSKTTEPTLCAGDDYAIEAVGVDYPAYEDGPGQTASANGTAQTPVLTGAAGQTDITVAVPMSAEYGGSGTAATSSAKALHLGLPHGLAEPRSQSERVRR